jgi:hypothetical protein
MNGYFITLRNALVGGSLSGVQLEALLTTDARAVDWLSAWATMVRQRASMLVVGASHSAMLAVTGSATAFGLLVRSSVALQAFLELGMLEAQTHTTSGNLSIPTIGYYAAGALCVGAGGGSGGTGNSSWRSGGGAGGNIVAGALPAGLTGNIPVTVGPGGAAGGGSSNGADGAASSVGAHVTAAGGKGSIVASSGAPNNGPGGVASSLVSTGRVVFPNLTTALWHPPFAVRGGIGSDGNTAGAAAAGGSAVSVDGQVLGAGGAPSAQAGQTWGGGGSGCGSGTNTGAAGAPNSGAGASGAGSTGSSVNGQAGGSGVVRTFLLRRWQ